jgi:hypothetical protein
MDITTADIGGRLPGCGVSAMRMGFLSLKSYRTGGRTKSSFTVEQRVSALSTRS